MDIGQKIINTTDDLKNVQKDFANFTAYNNLFIIIAASVCIGIATRDVISDIMNDTLLPLIAFIFKHGIFYLLYNKILTITHKHPTLNIIIQHIGKLIWLILVWVLTLFLVYFIFKKLIKIDFISDKINFVQDVTKYLTKQEQKPLYNR